MADMKAAGINPILAAGNLGGASQPGGAQGQVPDMSPVTSSAIHGMRAKEEVRLLRAQRQKTQQDTRTSAADQELKLTQAATTDQGRIFARYNEPWLQMQHIVGTTARDGAKLGYDTANDFGTWVRGLFDSAPSPTTPRKRSPNIRKGQNKLNMKGTK